MSNRDSLTCATETVVLNATELCGTVELGDQRGRTIGFPTANLPLAATSALANGVYAGRVTLSDGRQFVAAVNVGHRPTIYTDGVRLVEAHLIGFDGDLYGSTIVVRLTRRLRDEQRFGSLEELQAQIALDTERAIEAAG
ncbi:MAG: riboflavin kinase [Ilumatobacteraceae bacterium]|nr:riboflavin kinase [Ilumatobacteraceae bacterium]